MYGRKQYMKEESTTGLLNILNNITPEQMDGYIEEHARSSGKNIFSDYIAENKIVPADIVKNCSGFISKSYVYDILNGKKENPSRDVILMLCISAHMDRKMTRRVLEVYGHRDLYAKDTRDIIIATYINNQEFDLNEINDKFSEYGLTVFDAK